MKQRESMLFRKRLFLCFVLFVGVPVLVTVILYSSMYGKNTQKSAVEYSQNQLMILGDSFDRMLKTIKETITHFSLNRRYMEIVTERYIDGTESAREHTRRITEMLNEIYYSVPDVHSVAFMDLNEGVYQVGMPYYLNSNELFARALADIPLGDSSIHWKYYEINNEHFVSAMCRLVNLDENYRRQDLGVIMLLIDESAFYKLYERLNMVYNSSFYLLNEDNVIVSSNKRGLLGRELEVKANGESSVGGHVSIGGASCYYTGDTLNQNGWRMASLIPVDAINQQIYNAQRDVFFIVLLCVVCALLTSYVLSYNISKPINVLFKNMMKLETGDFSVHISAEPKNEFNRIFQGFNKMTVELHRLFQSNIDLQTKTKDAQLQAYFRQINPHFIYNTLEMIRMMAALGQTEQIQEATICLSDVMRFNLVSDEDVMIHEELENLDSYFRILKFRYGDSFDYDISVDDGVGDYFIPRFIIQPFVENSVIHGMKGVSRKFEIRVTCRKNNGEIALIINDNGIGMSREKLEEINGILSGTSVGQGGNIGIRNISERIRLKYGSEYGVSIYSKEGSNTTVVIHVPMALSGGGRNV